MFDNVSCSAVAWPSPLLVMIYLLIRNLLYRNLALQSAAEAALYNGSLATKPMMMVMLAQPRRNHDAAVYVNGLEKDYQRQSYPKHIDKRI